MIPDCRNFHSKTVFQSSKVLILSSLYKNIEYSCLLRLFPFLCSIYINISYLLLQMYSWFSFMILVMYLTGRSICSMKKNYFSFNPALLMYRFSWEFFSVGQLESVTFYPYRTWHHIFFSCGVVRKPCRYTVKMNTFYPHTCSSPFL